jgi:regulator of protease activity HflC (stomatin/prohibitin superfamily)
LQIIVAAVPGLEAITRDNVTVKVDAAVYYRVIDPVKAIINVQNHTYPISQVAQTSLRSVIGQSDMDQLLFERDKVNAQLKDVIDAPAEGPWGVRVERVEVKEVSLPESMKRSMSRQAEAERERRGSSPPTTSTRHPRIRGRPPPSCPPTRLPCSCCGSPAELA